MVKMSGSCSVIQVSQPNTEFAELGLRVAAMG